ncbi:LysR family transcriptional regulator [Nocardia transvalensis]|uniref:LysR family transcriptional regulator n=1 Tax=Nocardia transvalensis TaxID=37333 RepID=UPI001894B9C2|nr:LysR family transcriptional regulator [Nocardia transvalensis]MBF6331114.1 LysR family transcriptional regulator [Nocardia transvalensis]
MDLNLLRVLNVLLQENSVTVAAERLGTSAPAVSRTLAKLRRLSGDPLLVRAGQRLVPTQRALEIRDTLSALLRQADQLLAPGAEFDPRGLRRTFAVQASELFVTGLAVPLLAGLRRDAPDTTVVFRPESLEDTAALRRGEVDLEVGVLSHLDPETLHRPLLEMPVIGVAREGNPIFDEPIDAARYAAFGHIGISRRGRQHGPIDEALAERGLHRRVAVVVPSHTSAMLLARSTDLIALTAADWLTASSAGLGLRTFDIPLDLPPVAVGMAWHPRSDHDPAHRWFRHYVSSIFDSAGTKQTKPLRAGNCLPSTT